MSGTILDLTSCFVVIRQLRLPVSILTQVVAIAQNFDNVGHYREIILNSCFARDYLYILYQAQCIRFRENKKIGNCPKGEKIYYHHPFEGIIHIRLYKRRRVYEEEPIRGETIVNLPKPE